MAASAGERKERRDDAAGWPHFFGLRRAERAAPLRGKLFIIPQPMALEPAFIGNGEGGYRDGKRFYIDPEARKRHLAVFGGTGSGKSTLLKGMIADDIAAGHGVTVVDPHGQLVEDILATTSRNPGSAT